jgi:hypothetical protein
VAFIRQVKTKSGAIAIQIAYKRYGKIVKIEHIGSAHNKQEEDVLVSLANHRLHANQPSLFNNTINPLKLNLESSSSNLLRKTLLNQYDYLGFNQLKDEIFALLCVARIVEPTSKLDSIRVLADLGIDNIDKNKLYRCLKRVINNDYRKTIN